MNDVDRMLYLVDEISVLKTRADAMDSDAGGIYTAVRVLQSRVSEVKNNLYAATAAFPNAHTKEKLNNEVK